MIGICLLLVSSSFIRAQSLPPEIKKYLGRNYPNWKLSRDKCYENELGKAIVQGNFNNDKRPDYAVKFTRGRKGYILAFLAQGQNYKAFVLHNTDAEDVNNLTLGIWEKGSRYELGERNIFVKYDAPSDFRCESDVGGIHLYRNGKFKAY
jgi:hypothetical protein